MSSKLNIRSNYLKLYIGCMFSGKSTSLLNEISKYQIITDKIMVVNHVFDKKRRNQETVKENDKEKNVKGTAKGIDNRLGFLHTHSNKTHTAYMISELNELQDIQDYKTIEIVIIDEGQFFSDLYTFINKELKEQVNPKIFIVGGLSGDYNMSTLGEITKLIPLADEIIKLNAYCVKCNDGTIASFTKRIVTSSDQILIGASDAYIPVCRYHHT